MSRLEKIRAQHAAHDMSDSDEFYLLGRVTELESALQSQISKIDAWAADTRPGRAHEVLSEVGQIARSTQADTDGE